MKKFRFTPFILVGILTSPTTLRAQEAPELANEEASNSESISSDEASRDPAAAKKKSSAKSKSKKSNKKTAAVESTESAVAPSNSSGGGSSIDEVSIAQNNSGKKSKFSAIDVWNIDIFKDESHKVLVLQDRKYTKAKRFELGVELGKINASPFYRSFSGGAHATYHLSEYIGIEGFASAMSSSLSGDGKQINDFLTSANFGATKEFQEPKLFGGLGVLWSPIYGKFAFFRKSIIHFDFFGSAGVSVLTTETNVGTFGGKDQTHIGSLLTAGMRVFLSNHWSLRFDVRNNIYRSFFAAPRGAGAGSTLTRTSFQFMVGSAFLFGG